MRWRAWRSSARRRRSRIFFRLIAEVGPARASVITYVNPAVAVALGCRVLGERFTPAMAVAFALILGGSVLATRTGGRRAAPGPERATGQDSACCRNPEPHPTPGRP